MMAHAESSARPRRLDPQAEPPILQGRLPPHDLQAEAAVISACLLDAAALHRVASTLDSEAFYSDAHRLFWDAITDLHGRGEPVDVVTVNAWLRERQLTQRAGGAKYLTEVLDTTPAVANVAAHADTVRALRQRRRLISECQRIAAEGYDVVGDAWVGESFGALRTVAEAAAKSTSWPWVDGSALALELPPIPWVVDGLELAPGPPSMIGGYGYSGKTMTAQSLGLAVATGTKLWGRFDVRQGLVRHLDYEQGMRLTAERYQRLARALGVDFKDVLGDLGFVSLIREKIDDLATENVLRRELEGVTLAIVDSFRAAAPTIDENSSAARGPLDMLARVSEATGCCIVVIHHARKSTAENTADIRQILRGSAAIFDACQAIWAFSAKKEEPTLAQCAKARLTGRALPDFLLRTEDVPTPIPADHDPEEPFAADPRWGLRLVVDEVLAPAEHAEREAEQILDLVAAKVRRTPGMTTGSVVEACRRRHQSVRLALDTLEANGRIRGLKKPGRGGGWGWYAVDAAPEAVGKRYAP